MRSLTHQVWSSTTSSCANPSGTVPVGRPFRAGRRHRTTTTALVELLQRSTGMDADRVLDQLRQPRRRGTRPGHGRARRGRHRCERGSLAQLSLGKGFADTERGRIVDRLSQLNRHLKRFPADDTWLELTVKDRETTSQVVTLSAELPRLGRLQASSKEDDLMAALADVRQDLIRQIDGELDKRSRGAR